MIDSWFVTGGHYDPQDFDLDSYLGYLSQPYKDHVDTISVTRFEEGNYLLQRDAPRTSVVRFWFNPFQKEWQGPHIIR